ARGQHDLHGQVRPPLLLPCLGLLRSALGAGCGDPAGRGAVCALVPVRGDDPRWPRPGADRDPGHRRRLRGRVLADREPARALAGKAARELAPRPAGGSRTSARLESRRMAGPAPGRRILLVTNWISWAGAENQLSHLALGLRKRGHSVVLLATG